MDPYSEREEILCYMLFINVDMFISDQFNEERIYILVCFVCMDILRKFHRAYPWVVMAPDEILQEVTTVIPPE